MKQPHTYNNMHSFSLGKGQHSIYMRVISDPVSSHLNLKNLTMECLSYRQFTDKDKDN